MTWWFSDLFHSDPMLLASHVFWVVFSICLHELGHGWAAIRRGDTTPIETGHMTWNPLVHMGAVSLVIFALTGYAWGLMPVNPSRLRGRHAEAYVAFAGPSMNLGLALLSAVALALWSRYAGGAPSHVYDNVITFFFAGAYLNVVLCCLNLLPVVPLDGARIVADFVPAFRRLWDHPHAAMIGLGLVFLGFRFIGGPVSRGAADAVLWMVQQCKAVLP